MTGGLFSDVSGSEFWVIKIDNQGNKVWEQTAGGSGFDVATSSAVAPNGNYLVAGFSNSNASGDKTENSKGGFDYWIVALKEPKNPAVTTLTLMNAQTDLNEGRLQVDVFPLPASGVVNIVHKGKNEQAQMTLLDFNGNVVLTRPLSQQPVDQLDVSGLRKGIHYLKIVSPEGLQIIRIVVE